MTERKRKAMRGLMRGALVFALAAGAAGVWQTSASGQSYGSPTHNCYGIYWNTDWNQDCGSGGATHAGTYNSTANCKAPQIPDKHLSKYRPKGNRTSYDGPDCQYGIHGVSTSFQQ